MFSPLRKHTVNSPRRKRRKKARPEEKIQKAWVTWARAHGVKFCHVNNGASSKLRRIWLWAMGCEPGVADVLVFNTRLPVRGLALEFKSATGVQSPDQIKWQAVAESLGWVYWVVRTKDEAVVVTINLGAAR